MGAKCRVKLKDGKISQLQGSLERYWSLGVEGALSRTGGSGVWGRTCCSLASMVWCQWNLSSCLGYSAADLLERDIGRRCVRSLLGQRLGGGHGIMGFRSKWEKIGRWCEDLFNAFIPGGFGFVLPFRSPDYLEAIQLPPVWREYNKNQEKCLSGWVGFFVCLFSFCFCFFFLKKEGWIKTSLFLLFSFCPLKKPFKYLKLLGFFQWHKELEAFIECREFYKARV